MNCDIFKPKDNDTKHLKKVYVDHDLTLVIAEPTSVTSDTIVPQLSKCLKFEAVWGRGY